jgi:hypothetical protein
MVFHLNEPGVKGLQEFHVRLFEAGDDEVLGEFRKYYRDEDMEGEPKELGRWPLVVAAGDYRLEGDLITSTGPVAFTKKVALVDGRAISVYIDPN